MPKKILVIAVVFLGIAIGILSVLSHSTIEGSYEAIDTSEYEISVITDSLISPTRIKITPDGNTLLVAQITGEVLAFTRNGDSWSKKPYELVKIDTHFPGFPSEEAGLVGMVFSAEYETNGKLFLLYTYKDDQEVITNRIAVTTLETKSNRLVASSPTQIFESNTPGNISHQITDGIGIKIENQPHLLFVIGEGFEAKKAQDVSLEAGKIMIISEDGGNPLGKRPYPTYPKIQSVGLRNSYVVAPLSSPQSLGEILIGDTGPDKYDRLLYVKAYDPDGSEFKTTNLGWDGSEEKLSLPIPDPNQPAISDVVLARLPTTLTYTGLATHPGKNAIPQSTETKQSLLLTLFGKTGALENQPGKEIVLGILDTSLPQPTLTTTAIVRRKAEAQGSLGNPIGLEVDPVTGNFYFADIFEGKLYQVTIK